MSRPCAPQPERFRIRAPQTQYSQHLRHRVKPPATARNSRVAAKVTQTLPTHHPPRHQCSRPTAAQRSRCTWVVGYGTQSAADASTTLTGSPTLSIQVSHATPTARRATRHPLFAPGLPVAPATGRPAPVWLRNRVPRSRPPTWLSPTWRCPIAGKLRNPPCRLGEAPGLPVALAA